MTKTMLTMNAISKSFFGVRVLHDVSLSVLKGETHALLGENGAGKSTLMNILGGVLEKDGGEILLDGKPVPKITTKTAAHFGIAFVHQELNLVNDLKVYENIFLREEITGRLGRLKKAQMIAETEKLFESLGVVIDPRAVVGDLETSKKQLLEISKALRRDAQLFILDEPTTALGNTEIDNLFQLINQLKARGKSFIFISHKMPEIFSIADRYTVLRNGHFISTGSIAEVTPKDVTKMMVGDSYDDTEVYRPRPLSEPILSLQDLSGEGFEHVNLTVYKGEIFSLTGLEGSGCSDLMQCIFGQKKPTGGKIMLSGKEYKVRNIHHAMKHKLAMVPSNRKENSIIADMSLLENTYISEHTLSAKKQHIVKKAEIENYNRLKQKLNIKAQNENERIVSLSGGNQQKVILARWFNTDADIYLFDNPTQGIDVGAKNEIYKLIANLSRQGKTVLVNTLEISEIQKISDRCGVFYHANLKVILDRNEINEEAIMLHATNAISIAEVSQ